MLQGLKINRTVYEALAVLWTEL